ncbi:MAG: aspartate--tRNA(Asn) ligase [Candidatus Dojkabacteria bacterium]
MDRTLVNQIEENIGNKILIKGWLYALRKLGKLNFMIIRDRSGVGQIVIEDKKELEKVKMLREGSVLEVVGIASKAEKAELGAEIINPEIEVITAVSESMPIELNKDVLKAHIDTILDYRPLTLRHKSARAIFKVQATLVKAYRDFLTERGFVEFFGPNIIGASSEGGSELFTVDYFDAEAKLSQSAQLYKQIMVGAYERVFALMKCFRAEKSSTRRHLTEATQFEFEMGFIKDFSEVMDMLEEVVKYMIEQVSTNNARELEVLGARLALAPVNVSFPRVTFKDALELVYERTGIDERGEDDLSPMAEKELCNFAREEYGTDFILVTHFLRKKTAFYAHPNEDNPEVSNYFDLLCREIEVVSGGQRIHDHDMLVESLEAKELDPTDFADYLSIFKFGMPAHGGFGMGMERFTMMALGLDNIRYATLFPSDTKRIAGVSMSQKVYLGSDLYDEIIKRLDDAGVQYDAQKHEAVRTSKEASEVRGTKDSEGVKAIILRNKKTDENIMACVPADQKLDVRRVNELAKGKFEFEKPEVIKEKYGIDVGGVPPFGNLLGLKTYFSKEVLNEPRAAFNAGARTRSLVMKSKDLVDLVRPELF